MATISSIIFDLGGVILDIDIHKTTEALKELGLTDIDQLFGYGLAKDFFKDYENGKINDQQFVDDIKNRINRTVADEKIIEAWNKMLLRFPPERINLLHQLKKKYRLFLFSNTNSLHYAAFQKMYKMEFAGASLDDLFEKAYYSHLIGYRKPDRKSYEHILSDSNLKPQETAFIDDALVNIDGAKEAGLITIYLEPGKSIADLELMDL
jgi:glucose-1-phosphatase